MRADLYVYAGSFEHNQKDCDTEVLIRLSEFKDLTQRVPKSDNQFLFNTDEFENTCLLADGTTCGQLMKPDCKQKQEIQKLFLLLITSGIYKKTLLTGKEIDGFLELHDKNSCSAKVILSQKDQKEELPFEVIAKYENWQKFRSHYLGLYPLDVNHFYEECSKYYPNLKFGERYKQETDKVLKTHSKQITNCLYNMNTYLLKEYRNSTCSRIDFPEAFARKFEIKDGGSFQGDKNKKKAFEIPFEGFSHPLICEPHLKFNSPDNPKMKLKREENYCRIHFYMPSCKTEKFVYIGAIVRHL